MLAGAMTAEQNNPMSEQMAQIGNQMTQISQAMSSAMAAGDFTAYGQLADLYAQAYKMYDALNATPSRPSSAAAFSRKSFVVTCLPSCAPFWGSMARAGVFMYAGDRLCIPWEKGGGRMRKYAAAGLVLTVLLFGGAYLAAGGPAAEPEPAAPETAAVHHDRDVTLTIQDGDTTEQMTLERYLTGVVRGEMPASFEMEALRAQAAAERSYVYYQLAAGRKDAHPDADFCTDHTCCSAYLSETAAREQWGGDFAPWNTRVEQAVSDTDGQVVLYNSRLRFRL